MEPVFWNIKTTPFYKTKSLLKNGQILIDSSDIIYMFDNDEDGGKWIPSNGYYGELTLQYAIKNEKKTISLALPRL
jgi:hypothetical protein